MRPTEREDKLVLDIVTPKSSPSLPAGQALVLLSCKELDQLPDHGLRGHGQGGGQLLPRPGEEQLGVQRLQQGQTLRQTVHKHIGGELGDQLSEGGHGDTLEERSGLPVIASLKTDTMSVNKCTLRELSRKSSREGLRESSIESSRQEKEESFFT